MAEHIQYFDGNEAYLSFTRNLLWAFFCKHPKRYIATFAIGFEQWENINARLFRERSLRCLLPIAFKH